MSAVVLLVLASAVAGQPPHYPKALCPGYPDCDNALLAASDKIYKESLAPAGGPQAPGLVPGSPATHQGQLAHHVSKRQAATSRQVSQWGPLLLAFAHLGHLGHLSHLSHHSHLAHLAHLARNVRIV